MKASHRHASIVVLLGLGGLIVVIAVVFGALWWLTKGRVRPARHGTETAALVAPSINPAPATGQPSPAPKPWAVKPVRAQAGDTAGESSLTVQQAAAATSQATAMDQEAADPRAAQLVQSFSCSGKLAASRSWICSHWSLATQDYNLSLQYRSALIRSSNPRALEKARAAWLGKLNALGANTPAIMKSYRQWSETLSKS